MLSTRQNEIHEELIGTMFIKFIEDLASGYTLVKYVKKNLQIYVFTEWVTYVRLLL